MDLSHSVLRRCTLLILTRDLMAEQVGDTATLYDFTPRTCEGGGDLRFKEKIEMTRRAYPP